MSTEFGRDDAHSGDQLDDGPSRPEDVSDGECDGDSQGSWGKRRRPSSTLGPYTSKKQRTDYVRSRTVSHLTQLQIMERRTGVQWSLTLFDPVGKKVTHKYSDGLDGLFGQNEPSTWIETLHDYNKQLALLAGVASENDVPFDPLPFENIPGGREVQNRVTFLLALKACTGFAGTMLGRSGASVEEFRGLRCDASGKSGSWNRYDGFKTRCIHLLCVSDSILFTLAGKSFSSWPDGVDVAQPIEQMSDENVEAVYHWALTWLCDTVGPKAVVDHLAGNKAFRVREGVTLPFTSYRRMAHRLIQAMPAAGKGYARFGVHPIACLPIYTAAY